MPSWQTTALAALLAACASRDGSPPPMPTPARHAAMATELLAGMEPRETDLYEPTPLAAKVVPIGLDGPVLCMLAVPSLSLAVAPFDGGLGVTATAASPGRTALLRDRATMLAGGAFAYRAIEPAARVEVTAALQDVPGGVFIILKPAHEAQLAQLAELVRHDAELVGAGACPLTIDTAGGERGGGA